MFEPYIENQLKCPYSKLCQSFNRIEESSFLFSSSHTIHHDMICQFMEYGNRGGILYFDKQYT